MSRHFTSDPPKGWISKDKLQKETGIGDRPLADWTDHFGLKTCLVSRGSEGMDSYYGPNCVATINRARELIAEAPRDMNQRLWRLWLEGHDVDVHRWAKQHLASGLKELRRLQSSHRLIRNRVRSPSHRATLHNYAHLAAIGQAGMAEETSLHNIDPPVLELLLKTSGMPSNAIPAGELRDVEPRFSFHYLHRVLATATDEEIEQARRDWRMLAGWVDAAGAIDWNLISPDIDAKIRALTGAPADPPSWRARKAQRQRPLPAPPLIQFLIAFWPELAVRAAVFSLLIDLRRSPTLDQIITAAAAMIDVEFGRMPRRPAMMPATAL
jgi:hypothetical protein